MKTFAVAVVALCACAVHAQEKLPTVPLPISNEVVQALPRDEASWKYLWMERTTRIVEKVLEPKVRVGSDVGYSIIIAVRAGSDFREYVLVPPGQEPAVGATIKVKRARFVGDVEKAKDNIFTLIREKIPSDPP